MSQPPGASDDGSERRWLDDDFGAVDDRPADASANLVGLGFLTGALRRSAWFWRVTAVLGLLVGAGLYLEAPRTYQASTTLLLTVGAESQPGQAILEDQALAQSHAMAGLTLRKLGLQESVGSFLASYTVTPLTDRVLQITATAPSSPEAVRRAKALATGYLAFRADQIRAAQQLEFTALDQQVAQAKARLAAIGGPPTQPASPPGQPASTQRDRLSALRAQEAGDLATLEQQVGGAKAAAKVNTATMIGGSAVLDTASAIPPHSRMKHLILYAGGGLIIGLILGMGIIVLRALLSDRLRRRDDVAHALGAPVKLSVPAARAGGLLPGGRGRVPDRYMQRIVAYLRAAVPADSRRMEALAVVPVDDPRAAARSVVSLAESCAQQGRRIVVADLCGGAPAAMLLGAKGPGVHTVSMGGARLVAAVPDAADFAPAGPLRHTSSQSQPADPGELAAACASADVLLTLITLDPSVGGDHLATWAHDAVVMVTAGQSSWTKIHAVGEMIRLAGTRLISAVLVGADKTDESLGVAPIPEATPGTGRDAAMAEGMQLDAEGPFTAGPPGRRAPAEGAVSRLQMDPPEHVGRRRRTGP